MCHYPKSLKNEWVDVFLEDEIERWEWGSSTECTKPGSIKTPVGKTCHGLGQVKAKGGCGEDK